MKPYSTLRAQARFMHPRALVRSGCRAPFTAGLDDYSRGPSGS